MVDDRLLAELVTDLEADVDYTLVVAGDEVDRDVEILLFEDQAGTPGQGNLLLRVIHAGAWDGASEQALSLRTVEGEPYGDLGAMTYRDSSGFQSPPAGSYDLKFTSEDGLTNVIDFEPVEWLAGVRRTLVIMGDGVRQPRGVVSIQDGRLETRTPVDNSVTGWWASALGGNEGFIFQPIPAENRLIGTIYTWDAEGLGQPRWYTFDTCSTEVGEEGCVAPGGFAGTRADAAVYGFSGGVIGDTLPADGFITGEVSIEFVDCSNADVVLQLDNVGIVEWELTRLTATLPCELD